MNRFTAMYCHDNQTLLVSAMTFSAFHFHIHFHVQALLVSARVSSSPLSHSLSGFAGVSYGLFLLFTFSCTFAFTFNFCWCLMWLSQLFTFSYTFRFCWCQLWISSLHFLLNNCRSNEAFYQVLCPASSLSPSLHCERFLLK